MKRTKHTHRWIATERTSGHCKATILSCIHCGTIMVQSYPNATEKEAANPTYKAGRMALVASIRKELGI